MLNAYIYDGLRSPIGRHAGELASVRPDDLAAAVLQKLLEKTGVPGAAIEDVILGDTNQGGEDSRNVARNALLIAGLTCDCSRPNCKPFMCKVVWVL